MRYPLAALVLALAGSVPALARDALADIDACVARLDRARDVGFERIAARCPELAPSLLQSDTVAWLPRGWDGKQLSADGLIELRTLLERAAAPAAGGHAPDVKHLAGVLARVAAPEAEHGGPWARFKRWLHAVLEPHPSSSDTSWLRRLFNGLNVSESLLEGITWGVLALVVVLALTVVVNELRVAGVFGRGRRQQARSRLSGARARLTLADVDAVSLEQRPQRLLELLSERLAEQQRLPPARALTVRELTRAARLPEESERERLRELAEVCEGVRFAPTELAAPVLAAALAHGRELLALIESAPHQQVAG